MGSITSCRFFGNSQPKDRIAVNGIDLKANASEQDVELYNAVLDTGHPNAIILSSDILCRFSSGFYTSDKSVRVRMKASDGSWTDWADATS